MKKIAVFGAGGFGREVKMLIDQINLLDLETYQFVGFYDDGEEKGKLINEFPVLGNVSDLNEITEPLHVVIAIGNPILKKKILQQINNPHVIYPSLIHPNALIGKDGVSIGEGAIIGAGNIITVNIEIGQHVILNLACTVGHDTFIGDFCSFMPGVNVSGEVEIGDCVYVGTGAKIINRLTIGENTIIGAGTVVSKSLPANCTAVGVPAKVIKFHE